MFDNSGAWLHYPKFSIPNDDQHDLIVLGHSMGTSANKIHWSSKDQVQACAISHQPPALPSHKPNPAKMAHRQISNIDLYCYFGYCTQKNIDNYQSVCDDTVTLHNTLTEKSVTLIHSHFVIAKVSHSSMHL